MKKEHNHLYPAFHIRKWIQQGGKIYDKENKSTIKIKLQDVFTESFYYSLGEKNSELEDRLSVVESNVGSLIKRIDTAKESVKLTRIELEMIKLYCYLCACRHSNTCEVIKSDESGIYQSNHYLIGTPKITSQKEAVKMSELILTAFEELEFLPCADKNHPERQQEKRPLLSSLLTGELHLVIFRANTPMLMVSDRLCIIENTLDSDHLYAYTPISPTTALLLVKSKYFFNEEIYGLTRIRFGMKYGIGEPDPFLSEMLKGGFENRLFCAYYSQSTLVEQAQNGCDSIYVKIQSLPNEVFRSFNSIYCEDGKRILFCDREELDKALSMTLSFRNIKVSF